MWDMVLDMLEYDMFQVIGYRMTYIFMTIISQQKLMKMSTATEVLTAK